MLVGTCWLGIHPSRILLTGSPMREVLDSNSTAIEASDVLDREGLSPEGYFLVSLHREENVKITDAWARSCTR